MSDLISRNDAIEAVQKLIRNNQTEITEWLSFWVIDEIRTLPAADAVSREEYESMKRANEFNMRICSEVEHELHDLKQKQAEAVQRGW